VPTSSAPTTQQLKIAQPVIRVRDNGTKFCQQVQQLHFIQVKVFTAL